MFLRQDMLYRMRRSCLIPPSADDTSDPFEHVSPFPDIHKPLWLMGFMSHGTYLSFAACCYYNSSKPPLPSAFECTAHHMEL